MATPVELDAILDEMIEDGELQEVEIEKSAYRIGGKSEAAWAMEKLRSYVERQKENDEVAADRIQAVRDWQEAENGKLKGEIDYFEGLLRTWHMSQVELDPKHNKTITFPDGKISVRQLPGTLQVDDETFIPWALLNRPEWVRTKHEPVKAEIKKAGAVDAETGELAPGVELVPGEMSWKVETA